jgi:hypothetical protein
MASRNPRDPWSAAWRALTADATLATLLILVAAALALAASFPQVPGSDAVARARHLSSLQVRFGSLTRVIESAGLLSVTQSWGFRALIAAVACCICFRIADLVDSLFREGEGRGDSGFDFRMSWVRTGASGDVTALVSQVGAILLIIGAAATQIWGWEISEVVLQGHGRVTLGDGQAWAAMTESGHVATSPAVRIREEYRGPGVRVHAVDREGQVLPLQQSPDAAPAPKLDLPLIRDADVATRHALFAIPQASLVIRLVPQDDASREADGDLLVQAYRSPSGELEAEATVGDRGTVAIDDVTLGIESAPYVMITVGRSPGVWPASIGVILVLTGIVGSLWRHATELWFQPIVTEPESVGPPSEHRKGGEA